MRKVTSVTLFAAVIAAAVAAPAGAQSLLDNVTGKLARWSGAAPPSGGAFGLTAPISPAQSAAIDRLLAEPVDDPKVAADRADAAALIRSLLVTGACNRDGRAWQAFNERTLEPHSFLPDEDSAMRSMQYHDRKVCLDVVRLGDWDKPALNALGFQAYYVAPDSGEAKRQGFDLQKGSDGQWIVRQIGTTF